MTSPENGRPVPRLALVLAILGGLGTLSTCLVCGGALAFGWMKRMDSAEPRTLTSDDGSFEIRAEPFYVDSRSLHADAVLRLANTSSEGYLLGISEAREDFDDGTTLHDVAQAIVGAMRARLEGATSCELREAVVDGRPALTCDFEGTVENVRIVYRFYVVETPRAFVQLLAWTLPSRREQTLPALDRMIASVRFRDEAAAATAAPER